MNHNAIEISGLCKEYKDFALKDVAFALPQGYIMGLSERMARAKLRRSA